MCTSQTVSPKGGYLFDRKALLILFAPLVVEKILEYALGMVDSLMVSFVGEAAISSVSLIDSVMTVLLSVFAALATGGAVTTGQYLGSGDRDKASKSADQLIYFAGLVSVAVMLLVYLGQSWILNVLYREITPEVRYYAKQYLCIVALSIPFSGLYNAGAALFRVMGDSKLPLKIMMSANLLNVAGNALLGIALGWGLIGIAISTAISRGVAAIVILKLAMNPRNTVSIHPSCKFRFERSFIHKILKVGLPYGIDNFLFYFGRLILTGLISTFGDAAIAANAVASTVSNFQILPGMAINLGVTAVVSRCIGANDKKQTLYYTRRIMGYVWIGHVISCVGIYFATPYLMSAYAVSWDAVCLARTALWWHGLFVITVWPLSCTLPEVFRASGDAKFPLIIGISTMFLIRVVLAFLLAHYGAGMMSVWWAAGVNWIIRAVIYSGYYLQGKWMDKRVI